MDNIRDSFKQYDRMFSTSTNGEASDFSDQFKIKYNSCILTIEDLANLSEEQLTNILKEDIRKHLLSFERNNILGIEKAVKLYIHSKEEYEAVDFFLKSWRSSYDLDDGITISKEEFCKRIKQADVEKMKDVCFSIVRQHAINNKFFPLNDKLYPLLFVKENEDLFLLNTDLPDDVKQRYLNRDLTIWDLITYPDAFNKFAIDNFLYFDLLSTNIKDYYGLGKFQELVLKYSDVFLHILDEGDWWQFNSLLTLGNNIEDDFIIALKRYIANTKELYSDYLDGLVNTVSLPSWLSKVGFQFIDKIKTKEQLLQFSNKTIVFNSDQNKVIESLGIDNIKRLEQEMGFFSHISSNNSDGLQMFDIFSYLFVTYSNEQLCTFEIDFKNGTLSYNQFLEVFAKSLNFMRKISLFADFPFYIYDWMPKEFKERFPEIFISDDAPVHLKKAFYLNRINLKYLHEHKDSFPYLLHKDLTNIIIENTKLYVDQDNYTSFIREYILKYGNEKTLDLIAKYGRLLNEIEVLSYNGEFNDEVALEKIIKEAIYKRLIVSKANYSYLDSDEDLKADFPLLFVDFDSLIGISEDEKIRLKKDFYCHEMSYDDIRRYPQLIDAIKDKDLQLVFGKSSLYSSDNVYNDSVGLNYLDLNDLDLLNYCSNEVFLKLCFKYGMFLHGILQYLSLPFETLENNTLNSLEYTLSYQELSKMIEDAIVENCKNGNISYSRETSPEFLINNYPELFIDVFAPQELIERFYNETGAKPLTFILLDMNKEWRSFLSDSQIKIALLKNRRLKSQLIEYFETFGEKRGVKLGIARADTISTVLEKKEIHLMKEWYDKCGFIPDYVIMQSFDIADADKFLISSGNWARLMQNNSYAKTYGARKAMLKLAYSFGAFDHDDRGFNKAQELLNGLPKIIDASQTKIIDIIEEDIEEYSKRGFFFGENVTSEDNFDRTHLMQEQFEEMLQCVRGNDFFIGKNNLLNLLEAIRAENVNIDFTKKIFGQIYRKNKDGSYRLIINQQNCPRTADAVRNILKKYKKIPMITPAVAHQLFGCFELKYDPDFREFLLDNIDTILSDPKYAEYIPKIQKAYSDIKIKNSNRKITLDLAVSYVQNNRYVGVNTGNDNLAKLSAMVNYKQEEFDVLQQIYNLGKQRTFSSIPRIQGKAGKYKYEMLRLDDPQALTIGTESDCCQQLGDNAEACMEHSMVDKHGRIFVIKDQEGKVVAQSWVWRNRNVVCFDNIEIPKKAFTRATSGTKAISRSEFADEIFALYKQAAKELIMADEYVYKQLLGSGKISQEQFDGLKIGKVTVGLGNNDIADSIGRNAYEDEEEISKPLPFEPPIKLLFKEELWLSDSNEQYVLEEVPERKVYSGDTLALHSDIYEEYTNDNFGLLDYLLLQKLELVTKGRTEHFDDYDIFDKPITNHLLVDVADSYDLGLENIKIIKNPNFAIIYVDKGNEIVIADLLFNTKVDNNNQQMDIEQPIVLQIRLALEQIGMDKEYNIESLNDNQRKMFEKAINIKEEIDIERGISHAK